LASIVGAGTFFDGFDAIGIAVVLPAVVAAFRISFSEAATIISAGYAGQFIGALIIGALSDRFGRRRAFALSLIIFGSLALASAFAWSATSMLVFRLIQGLGLGAEVPVAGTLINEFLGRRSRGRISAIYQALFAWGLFLAPLVALLLSSTLGPELGWRVLLGVGALPILVAMWAWVALPESPRWLAQKGNITEAAGIVTGMEASARQHGHVLTEPTPTTVAIAPFRAGEMFSGQYGRRTMVLAILWFTTYFVVYGYSVWAPTLYVTVGRLPRNSSLALTAILGAVQVVSAYLVAWLVERIGRKPSLLFGFGFATIGGLFGVVNIMFLGDTAWQILFATCLMIAFGIVFPTVILYSYTAELYPTRMRGFASSSASSMARLASIFSPFLVGYLLDGHGGVGEIFAFLGGATVIGFVTMLVGGIETRNRPLEEISS
jgi:putative MFS transporter